MDYLLLFDLSSRLYPPCCSWVGFWHWIHKFQGDPITGSVLSRESWMHRIGWFFLFYFLAVLYINHHFFGFQETQTQTESGIGPGTLVPFFQEAGQSYQTTTALDSRNFSKPSLQRFSLSAGDLSRHVSVPIRRFISLALPVQSIEQKISRPLSAVQAALDYRSQTSYATGSILLEYGGGPVGRLGIAQIGPPETEAVPQQELADKERKRQRCRRERDAYDVTLCKPGRNSTMAVDGDRTSWWTTSSEIVGKCVCVGKLCGGAPTGASQRPSSCSEERISRYHEGATACERSSGKRGSLQLPENRGRPPQNFISNQQGDQAVEPIEGSAHTPQRAVVAPPQGFDHSMGKPDESLPRPTKTVHRADQQGQSRAFCSTQEPAITEQTCRVALECQSRELTRGPRCGRWPRGCGCFRSSAHQTSPRLSQASCGNCESQRHPRHHGLGGRGGKWSSKIQKAALLGAIWSSSTSWGCRWEDVKQGDGAECLRNSLHAPDINGWREGNSVEAYATVSSWHAACRDPPLDLSIMCLILCHSVRWEAHFMPTFVATKRAIDLQYEVANSLLLEGFVLHEAEPIPKWPVFGSIIRKSSNCPAKRFSFSLAGPVDDPLSFEAASITRSQARLINNHNSPSANANQVNLYVFQDAAHGEHPILPDFAQDLFAHFDALGFPHDFLHTDGCLARTWYIHHQEFPRWRVPRFVELDHDWTRWRDEFENSWRDMIDRNLAVRIVVVHPDPNRHYLGRRVDVDIILAQESVEGLLAGLLSVELQRVDRYHSFAIAISLPHQVSGRMIAQAAELGDECASSECSFSFRWTRLPLNDVAIHNMHEYCHSQGPRPLRSAERIFGLKGLTKRDLRQLSQGTQFYLQTTITIAWAICTGGLYVSEHPAPPEDPSIASVWKAPWTELYTRKLHYISWADGVGVARWQSRQAC